MKLKRLKFIIGITRGCLTINSTRTLLIENFIRINRTPDGKVAVITHLFEGNEAKSNIDYTIKQNILNAKYLFKLQGFNLHK